MEIGLLNLLNTRCDPHDERHIVRMLDSFLFRKHLCIVFEKLDVNLFELLKRNAFKGLSLPTVQVREGGEKERGPLAGDGAAPPVCGHLGVQGADCTAEQKKRPLHGLPVPLPPPHPQSLLRQLLDSLSVLRDAAIMHCDLK